DGILSRDLAGVAASTGTPAAALAAELTLSLCAVVAFASAGTPAIDVFFYLATMGILSLLVMYIVTNIGALRYLFLGGRRRIRLRRHGSRAGGRCHRPRRRDLRPISSLRPARARPLAGARTDPRGAGLRMSVVELSERDLCAALRRGDEAAFTRLVALHHAS